MNRLDREVFTRNNTILMHQARAVCSDNIFGSCRKMTLNLITAHLTGNGMFFHGKHSSEATAFVRTFRLYDLNVLDQRQQVTQLVVIRNIQFTGRRKVHQPHAMTTVLNTYFMRERSLQRCRLHHVMNKLADIIHLALTGTTVFLLSQQSSVIVTYENHAAGRCPTI